MNTIAIQAKERIIGYILSALGLVAGLAWNEAIRGLIGYFLPIGKNTLIAQFGYAVFITVIVVIVSIYLTAIAQRHGNPT